ncbi:amidohydrolase [Plebeiibacterium marinum]|uniref:Omega-amidase YafV n=1 Tax=Plebeiibacterium marinum TaxID=2992111 RepID=A0AAE3MC91_9BACT|nr:amidohydrolase [Plebeiobacterium marinum]MCW3804919.1 amidohydrolase [Plebeiobacterium marinum]
MKLDIVIIQLDIDWEDFDANQRKVESLINDCEEGVDLVLLPEMFLSGFSMDVNRIAVKEDGDEVRWLKKCARKKGVAIMGSLAVKTGDEVYNSALFVNPLGEVFTYNKRHLFRMGGESKRFSKGDKRVVIEYKGVKILPLICYDLRFPVWSRNQNDYDVIIYMANWPRSRHEVWDVLLRARAIENQSYVIGVNRIGTGGGIFYSGGSKLIDFKGDVCLDMDESMMISEKISIDINKKNSFKDEFPVYLDSDLFNIIES